MPHSKLKHLIWVAATLTAGAAAQAEVASNRPPPAARKPLPVTDLRSAMDQTALVVEGQVTEVQYEYNHRNGPWTHVTLSDVRAHFGSAPQQLEIRQFGGPLPDGSMVVVAELPEFIEGERYVVFLRNTAWNLSPVVGNLAFRVETVGAAEALVNTDGLAVVGVDPRGVRMAPQLLEGLQPNAALPGSPELDGAQAVTDVTPPEPLGPNVAGVAARAVAGASAQNREPLDPVSFIAELDAILAAHGMAASGTFYERSAGGFNWYRQKTEPTAGEAAAGDAAVRSSGPEIDLSGPSE